jgi:hypothetical protein
MIYTISFIEIWSLKTSKPLRKWPLSMDGPLKCRSFFIKELCCGYIRDHLIRGKTNMCLLQILINEFANVYEYSEFPTKMGIVNTFLSFHFCHLTTHWLHTDCTLHTAYWLFTAHCTHAVHWLYTDCTLTVHHCTLTVHHCTLTVHHCTLHTKCRLNTCCTGHTVN